MLFAVTHRRAVSADEIVEHLWPEGPPARPEVGIRSLASELRRRLPAGLSIEASVGCYQMPLGPGALFDLGAATASAEMAEHLVRSGRPREAAGPALVATSIARHGVLSGWS